MIIDPQFQANTWLKEINVDELMRPDLLVLQMHNPRFTQLLSAAIKYGKKVLLENVGETIPQDIYPLFDRSML